MNKPFKAAECNISYVEAKKDNAARQMKELPSLKLSSEKYQPKIKAGKTAPPPFMDKDRLFAKSSQRTLRQIKPAFDQPDIVAMKKRINMPAVDMNKFKGTSYITYYQLVREKIRRIAYQKYSGSEVGYTYMTFIVSNDGLLKEVRLVKDRSSESAYLQQIALRSIKDASPFPAFPGNLDYPQLSFNVIISFEVE